MTTPKIDLAPLAIDRSLDRPWRVYYRPVFAWPVPADERGYEYLVATFDTRLEADRYATTHACSVVRPNPVRRP